MALPNDSVNITAGSGVVIATNTVSSKEYEVMMPAYPDGHIVGSKVKYIYSLPSQQAGFSANTVHWDLYNNSTAVKVRVLSIVHIPDVVTAVVGTGVSAQYLIERTTSVGSGGTVLTAWQPDTGAAALDAAALTGVSARSKPTTGASGSTDLFIWYWNSNPTGAHNYARGDDLGVRIIPQRLVQDDTGIMLYSGQGLRCVQVTGGTSANMAFWIAFTTE
jgi:hypothetical protein